MYPAEDIEALLVGMADERQAAVLQRFFKTGPGQYGEGDRFLGVKNPQVRSVVKEAWRNTTLGEAVMLVRSPWHEVRLCGLLIMVAMFEKALKGKKPDEATMKEIFEIYLSLHPFINNWDLVDLSAYKIAGRYELWCQREQSGACSSYAERSPQCAEGELLHPEITILDEWIKPEFTLWQRRISMVSTWIHIRQHQFDKAFARAEVLLSSDHDLLHKAAGWMLREIYKAADKQGQSSSLELPSGSRLDEVNHGGCDELEDFLEKHVAQMPSIMLSYTTELMPPGEREYWRKRRKVQA